MSYSHVPPLLRGLLRRRDTGPFVISRPQVWDERAIRLAVGAGAGAGAGSVAGLAGELGSQIAAGAGEPHAGIFSVEGLGSFYLGESYEEALALSEGRPLAAAEFSGQLTGRMAGRICLVTGGAQGFGEELVRHLNAEGAFTYIADINIEKARQLEAELNKTGRTSLALEVDVANEESIKTMIADVVKATGGLDLFISNAGIVRAGSVKTMSQADFDIVTNINYTAYFLIVKHLAPLLALQNAARGDYFTDIIQINSKSGLQGSNKNAAYAGGKFGGIGLTQSFALELVEDNIKVNSICPGNFFDGPLWSDPEKGLFLQYLKAGKVPGARTVADVRDFYNAKIPMGRGCRGEDVARAVYYAVEQKYETGQAIPVTGGQIMQN